MGTVVFLVGLSLWCRWSLRTASSNAEAANQQWIDRSTLAILSPSNQMHWIHSIEGNVPTSELLARSIQSSEARNILGLRLSRRLFNDFFHVFMIFHYFHNFDWFFDCHWKFLSRIKELELDREQHVLKSSERDFVDCKLAFAQLR